jgi:hypothetical protein
MDIFEERALFNYALANAFAHWTYIEHGLARIATAAVPKAAREQITIGFWGIENARSKIDFVDDLFKHQLAKQTTAPEQWDKIVLNVRGLSTQRNKLAHWFHMEFPAEFNQPGKRIALVQFIEFERMRWAGTYKRKPPPGSLFVIDVDEHKNRFGAMFARLHNIGSRLLGEATRIEEPDERGLHRRSLRDLRSQIREELPLPPLRQRAK